MKIKIAKKAGFCMGVRRAVNLVLKALNEKKSYIYTYGPLIHNPQTLKLLDIFGVQVLKDPNENLPSGVVIIRAHGVPPKEYKALTEKHKVIDGTCPRVLKVQALAKKAVSEGKEVVIIGDKDHAEVKGILGYCEGKGYVVSSEEDVVTLPPLKDYVILSQTTQDEKLFNHLSKRITSLYPNGKIINTICNATAVRQNEVRKLCEECSAIVVIGGKFSANTNRLADVAKKENKDVFLVESPEELSWEDLKKHKTVGITAGASTPNWLINEVVDVLKNRTSFFYKFLKAMCFSSATWSLTLFLIFLGLLLGINHPLNSKFSYLLLWFLSFSLFRNLLNQNLLKESFKFYLPIKYRFLSQHQKKLLFFAVLTGFFTLITAFLYKPRIISLVIALLLIDFLTYRSALTFFWEILFLSALSLYLYPFWTFSFGVIFLQAVLVILYLKLYLEIVYFQTDGFLPKNFLLSTFSYEPKIFFKILNLTILIGLLITSLTTLFHYKFGVFFLVWGVAYFLGLVVKKRPLGQVVYLETLVFIVSLAFLACGFFVRSLG
ncbi:MULTISPECIES: 4-hydroxy-3-methylbut-2-enyl diphosphate reductase [Thermodesulfobacterium]|jgi:4-hydroxy-3-methylbut-2-enyl diphosphate reductase|uniref:4-hydroxy-3-methylbut-2-enyl diphosphate reductase n=1 Tax=Thermodesulfobacterium commune TaxID=1741 RepID=A0A101FJQ0_9BACT|nr:MULTISPECIES: 4-hydroxy-3-methylbut-2-enyl diphosphate reductase [Thermodesulfobacterium]KUJ98327.1 MAG: 4-hydroxy-3-methylbut-2-enyl diphosphate reductase [Thermodesulfobacterium sp. 37_54]KUK19918.1 MAG: 4-hydroxy-3-methylbut-2-enyl diphosphate reductase [Thermodesulfobacterium commune]KUK38299.1 MAG: 4-hydroxy-3-methylbut-2-enyl diphosphate reductase [Thermodesulfobacterium commune]MBZ4681786.1 ispH [Thermodesulfobacterium sp.]MDN5379950.1 hypothetical protein [Thermodesulfobacterium sp.